MKNNTLTDTINFLVENTYAFSIFSMPNTNKIQLFVEDKKQSDSYFIIQPFIKDEKAFYISQDIFLENENINLKNLQKHLSKNKSAKEKYKKNITFLVENSNDNPEKKYINYVSKIVEECKVKTIEKCVAARIKKVKRKPSFDIGVYFLKLCKAYNSAFVNLYYHKNCGLWVGATPELLVKENKKGIFETYSLAGTKLISKKREWTYKEVKEQQIVTDYIHKTLEKNDCKNIKLSRPKTINAGMIQHIKTTIDFSTSKAIKEIAKILHPTPAVCGLPLKQSLDIIKKEEKNQRKNYAGFIGLITENKKELYVNLRCMQILEKEFLVFVGAGITKDSNAEKEFQETENKAQTLLSFL